MKKLGKRVLRKRELGKIYHDNLSGINGVDLIKTDLNETTPWFYDILCDNREKLIDYLKENGVGSRKFYPALHSEPAYGYDGDFPVTQEISERGLWLPSWVDLTDEQVVYICKLIRQFY